jgi:hypothetical protein
MRLFFAPDGKLDRLDRAMWITVPFDLAANRVTPPVDGIGRAARTERFVRRGREGDFGVVRAGRQEIDGVRR